VSGPIIAIALVLCAVFVPLAFISGLTGQFYKQFAVTIAISLIAKTAFARTRAKIMAISRRRRVVTGPPSPGGEGES
jgi:multidrug efflux pump